MYSNKKRMVGAVNNRGVGKQQAGPVVYEGMVDCFKVVVVPHWYIFLAFYLIYLN